MRASHADAEPATAVVDPQSFPEGATLLVAGPVGGMLDLWAATWLAPLGQAVPDGVTLIKTNAGGYDGVTGANQFDARIEPDGTTILLVPGEAAITWLAGDSRAQFDPSHWVGVATGMTPVVILTRLTAEALARHPAPRLAVVGGGAAGLSGLLALELLGMPATIVANPPHDAAAFTGLEEGDLDAVMLHGSRTSARLATYQSRGAAPLFCFGIDTPAGLLARDPQLPDVPHFGELHAMLRQAAPSGPLYDAWRASAVAARTIFALVLAQPTPAAMIAFWRKAAAAAAATGPSRQLAGETVTMLHQAAAAASNVTALAADSSAQTEFRLWLAARRAVR
jgi:hypothetical protein